MRSGSLVLLFALVVAGAGAVQVREQWSASEEEPRPFRTSSDADLATLHRAYSEEIQRLESRAAPRPVVSRPETPASPGRYQQNLAEFERVQARSRRAREAEDALVERRIAVAQIESEQRRRERGDGILARVTERFFGSD